MYKSKFLQTSAVLLGFSAGLATEQGHGEVITPPGPEIVNTLHPKPGSFLTVGGKKIQSWHYIVDFGGQHWMGDATQQVRKMTENPVPPHVTWSQPDALRVTSLDYFDSTTGRLCATYEPSNNNLGKLELCSGIKEYKSWKVKGNSFEKK